ncbi:hypothetical protein VUR80DRAFT_4446 [Thermomyces stellatus]
MIVSAYPGTTHEAIEYPACGGQASCGGIAYGDSARQGTSAVASQVNSFHQRCPNTQLILVGYSQGGQIMDNALCGGGDPGAGISDTSVPISPSAVNMIKAAIFMGDPRWQYGLAYQVGTCRAGGFDARPSGFVCPNASKVQSYCDAADPYCCNGNSQATHQGYVGVYGQQALDFINSKLGSESGGGDNGGGNGGGGESGGDNGGGSNCAAKWGQCGGQGWTGPTCCQSGSTCNPVSTWYSQCQ